MPVFKNVQITFANVKRPKYAGKLYTCLHSFLFSADSLTYSSVCGFFLSVSAEASISLEVISYADFFRLFRVEWAKESGWDMFIWKGEMHHHFCLSAIFWAMKERKKTRCTIYEELYQFLVRKTAWARAQENLTENRVWIGGCVDGMGEQRHVSRRAKWLIIMISSFLKPVSRISTYLRRWITVWCAINLSTIHCHYSLS